MIHCYKDKDDPEGVIVHLEGDHIEITSDFVCIASKMLNSGIPLEILCRSLVPISSVIVEMVLFS